MVYRRGFFFIFILWFIFNSCTIYEENYDNPVDFEANKEKGIGHPALVFYPKAQTKSISDSIIVESFIVFHPDSIYPFAGVHIQVEFPNSFLDLDTLRPGYFISDTNQATPLFTYNYNGENIIDIYAYFLDTLKLELTGTGHLADIIFLAASTGIDSIKYNLEFCEMITYEDSTIVLNGERGCEVVIE